ncbi:MAG TPA: hypothetical protein VFU34_02650, partial [Gaiellaceae bacterium]|nr:hypothetical protein [Gaiellaceae bacterium]
MSGVVATGELHSVPPGVQPLELIRSVASYLEEAGVRYCHWKSNAAIDRSATGDNDLDLLVHRADVRSFTEVLSRLGFVRASKPGAAIPGIESFYGHDGATGRLVHVHAHYRLVLGDDRTKNYRLPIEDAYLDSRTRSGLLPLPSAEFEYVVFVIRMTLKYCTWDEIAWCATRGRRAAPSRTERAELAYLTARVDDARAASVVEEHLPFVGAELFAECVAVLGPDASIPRR